MRCPHALQHTEMAPSAPINEGDRLPPLKPASANCSLLQNLKQLQAASLQPARQSPRQPASLDARSLRTISTVSRRANACVQELDAEMVASQASRKRGAVLDRGISRSIIEIVDAEALSGDSSDFETLVSEIDNALHGNTSNHRTLRKGEVLPDRLAPRGVHYFKVPLPSRPTEVTVSVSRPSGSKPLGLWASTSCEKPHTGNYEIKGKDDKIVYKHVLSPSQHEEDISNCVDRRHAVPSCREMFFAVEAQANEAHFELSVSFQPLNVVLTRKELAGQLLKIRRSWEARILELQREPVAREQFEEHIVEIKSKRAETQQTMSHGQNFVERNRRCVQDWTPRSKRTGLHKRALQMCARQEAASRRRDETKEKELELPSLVAHTPVEAVQAPEM